jgi:uncharacterized membrane protein YedE/YeeE
MSHAVLIVEDNPITRKFVRVVLAAEGIDVLEAESGEVALAISSLAVPFEDANLTIGASIGIWDASLALVMVGAIAVYFTLHRLIIRRSTPLFDTRFHLPTRKDLDRRLVLGAASFGVGWALAGYCPGPGLVSASGGALPAVGFVLSMAVGMKLEQLASQRMANVRGWRASAKPTRSSQGSPTTSEEP